MAELKDLNLSARVYNALGRAGITTTEAVIRMSDADLMAVKGFGHSCLMELREKIGCQKKTNGDMIREMTDEQLAMTIMCPMCLGAKQMNCRESCTECSAEWLREPVEV